MRKTFLFFFFLLLFNYFLIICTIYTDVQISTYVQISSMCWTAGGSAVQPLQGPDGKALSQPKPHPLSKIV